MATPKKKPATTVSKTTYDKVVAENLKFRELAKEFINTNDYENLCSRGKELYLEAARLIGHDEVIEEEINIRISATADLMMIKPGLCYDEMDAYELILRYAGSNEEVQIDHWEIE